MCCEDERKASWIKSEVIAFSQEIYTTLTKKLNESASFEGQIQLKGRTGATKVYSI